MRKKIAAGNWKMNTALLDGQQLASEVVNMAKDEVKSDVKIVLIPPFPFIGAVKSLVGASDNVTVGAQNCHEEASGAYTGEVSIDMIKSIGATHIVIGHSERREYFGEDHELLAKKTRATLDAGLTPIFCCGEKLDVREAGDHFKLVAEQVAKSLFDLSAEDIKKVVIAYEPVWAIGTGVTASASQAQEMHAFIRKEIANQYSDETANSISILYGGSVKPGNAAELFACLDVDGGLVGGASLKSRDFVDIAKSF
ncbi:MAG: triose-phosphate isomerase [Cytophagales bacterium]|nr:triose-phosphate isomerase [Cytophagales bacterium]